MLLNNYFLLDMSKCKGTKQLNKLQNNMLFIQNFMRLFEVAMSRYRLRGLPDTISERVVLQSFICYANVTFFKEGDNVLALPSAPSGKGFNVNGDPVSAWVFSKNGLFNKEIDLFVKGGQNSALVDQGVNYSGKLRNPTGVMVWENKSRFPFIFTIIYYAQAIADTFRTIDNAKVWLKQPFIPVCEESLVESVKSVFKSMKSNDDIIPLSSGVMSIDKVTLQPTGDPTNSLKSAMELVDWYEQQFRERCSIDSNTQVDKKGENLISDEVHINDEYTNKTEDNLLEYMQEQLDIVNEAFGLHITIEDTTPEIEISEEDEEVVDDETDEV